jgi:dimethylamine monooxygenase subunit C
MLITGVKSRPQYAPLQFDPTGRCHLLLGQGEGGAALLRLRSELPDSADVRVIYTGESLTSCDLTRELSACGWRRLTLLPTQSALLESLENILAECEMGTRLYVAGAESFIGSVEQVAARYNLQSDEIQREHQGSAARRVFCIHCKTSNADVTTNIVCCRGCGRNLVVRDHYSRRLAAFMGVMADAETPGCIPEIRQVFA